MIDEVVGHLFFDPMMEREQESDQADLDEQDFPGFVRGDLIDLMVGDHNDKLEKEDKRKEAQHFDAPLGDFHASQHREQYEEPDNDKGNGRVLYIMASQGFLMLQLGGKFPLLGFMVDLQAEQLVVFRQQVDAVGKGTVPGRTGIGILIIAHAGVKRFKAVGGAEHIFEIGSIMRQLIGLRQFHYGFRVPALPHQELPEAVIEFRQ